MICDLEAFLTPLLFTSTPGQRYDPNNTLQIGFVYSWTFDDVGWYIVVPFVPQYVWKWIMLTDIVYHCMVYLYDHF